MSVFNTRLILPGGYGNIVTEANANRNLNANVLGLLGPANGGTMGAVEFYDDAELALQRLGKCNALDMMIAAWSNGAGTIGFLRIGETKPFDKVFMDQAPTAEDVTTDVSRLYGQTLLFNTGGADWLYLGKDTQFKSIDFDVATAPTYTSGSVALVAEYYNGTSWATLAITSDGTLTTGKTLTQSGRIKFTAPLNWVAGPAPISGGGSGTYFWVRIRPAENPLTALSATMVVRVKNALQSYGLIVGDDEFTGEPTSNSTTTHAMVSADIVTDKFVINGDQVANLPVGSKFEVSGSGAGGANDGIYTVLLATLVTTTTEILTVEAVPNTDDTGTITISRTHDRITDTGEDFVDREVEVGDVVNNVSDGSSATVLAVESATLLTVSRLTGGVLNRTLVGGTPGGTLRPDALVSDVVDAVLASGSYTIIEAASANFITARVAANDRAENVTTPGNSGLVISVISATKLLVSGTWIATNAFKIYSAKILFDAAHNFATLGVRPGTVISVGTAGATGLATVTQLLDYDEISGVCNTILTEGLAGGTGTHFRDDVTADYVYTYTTPNDTYEVITPKEKAYLQAKEFGTGGNTITVEIVEEGSETIVTLAQNGYTEEYRVLTAATDPLQSILEEIILKSQIVGVVEDLTSGAYDLPTAMSTQIFSGGSSGLAEDEDYSEGLLTFLNEPSIDVVAADKYNAAINAALKAHVTTAASLNFQTPRVAVLTKPESESFFTITPALLAEPAATAIDGRTVYILQKATVGSLVTADNLVESRAAAAAAYAGKIAGTNPAQPLTNMALNVIAIDKVFHRADRSRLVASGFTVFDQTSSGITIVRSITTSVDTPYDELSVRRAVDLTELTVRQAVAAQYVGQVNLPGILTMVVATIEAELGRLRSRPAQGGTVRDWANVRASFNSSDKTRIDFIYEIIPLSPINFTWGTVFVRSSVSFS